MIEFRFCKENNDAENYRPNSIFEIDTDERTCKTYIEMPDKPLRANYNVTHMKFNAYRANNTGQEYLKALPYDGNATPKQAQQRSNARQSDTKDYDPLNLLQPEDHDSIMEAYQGLCAMDGEITGRKVAPSKAAVNTEKQRVNSEQGKPAYYDPIRASVEALGCDDVPRNNTEHLSYTHVLDGMTQEKWSDIVYCDLDKTIAWSGALKLVYDRVMHKWRAFIDMNAVETVEQYQLMYDYIQKLIPALEKKRLYIPDEYNDLLK